MYILWGITCVSASLVGLMILMLFAGHIFMVVTNYTTLDSVKRRQVCPIPFCEFRKDRLHTDTVNI